MFFDGVGSLHRVGESARPRGDPNSGGTRLVHGDGPVDARLAIRGDLHRPRFAFHPLAVDEQSRDRQSGSIDGGCNGQWPISVVVDDGRDHRLVTDDEESRRLKANDERFLRTRCGAPRANAAVCGDRPRGRAPRCQRIGIDNLDSSGPIRLRDDVWFPEHGRAEIAAHDDRRVGSLRCSVGIDRVRDLGRGCGLRNRGWRWRSGRRGRFRGHHDRFFYVSAHSTQRPPDNSTFLASQVLCFGVALIQKMALRPLDKTYIRAIEAARYLNVVLPLPAVEEGTRIPRVVFLNGVHRFVGNGE